MKLEKTAAIAEIVSSVAIVVTLGYLAIQTQQNTEAIGSSAVQGIFDSSNQQLQFLAENSDVIGLEWKPALTRDESAKLFLALTLRFQHFQRVWIQNHDGVVSNTSFDALATGPILAALESPRAIRYWNDISSAEFAPGFVAYVNTLIEDVPASDASRTWMFSEDANGSN